ncbi:divergent polysaccharide deacteylase family protein [Roseovarius salis]|uniref:divergent polysaccharide deacteylase family protein n=1 Tax=Roseovarius salis TaxID=3376063 RepID=UPI0037C68358
MLRGVTGGFLAGAILSAIVLGTASVLTDIPGQPPPEAAGVDVPAGSEFNQSREDREADMPRGDDAPEARDAPQVPPPEPDDLGSLDRADTGPAAQPETGEAESTLNAPQEQADSAGVNVESDEPVLPSPQSLAPEAPEGDTGVSISTEPAQPMQPDVEEDSGMFRSGAPAAEEEPPAAETTAPAAPGTSTDQPEPAREGDPAAAGTEEAAPDRQDDPDGAEADPPQNAAPAAEQERPSGTIGDMADAVTTGRLPTVADADGADEADVPPLERFAAPFRNPEDKPLMSIVLIDNGSSPISLEALADFPYPISYAIDAGWSGAAGAAREYRAAGLEVLAMADLPAGASAADAEVAMQGYLDAVPEAVAVMEGTDTGLQDSRQATEQLIPILKESGHGLVLFSDGLDTAQKLISRQGVPTVTVFRDFDADGQDATVIRRFLDQAAFKARQEEPGVVMVGRLRAETVSALLLWGLQDRASSVALAPVSAVLRASQD